MRVLYDTNWLVTFLCRREGLLAFKKLVNSGKIVNITSEYILKEVELVLARDMNLTKQKAKAAARLLARNSVIVSPQSLEKVCRDPFDDHVLAAAITGRVAFLVTKDKDLLVLDGHKGVRIIDSPEFLRPV